MGGRAARCTLGRELVNGAKVVAIDGERVPVRASVHTLGGLSAHAGHGDLVAWLGTMAGSRPRVILTHGEDAAREALAQSVEERLGLRVERPGLNETLAH